MRALPCVTGFVRPRDAVVRFAAPSLLAVWPAALAAVVEPAPAAAFRTGFFAGAFPEAARLAVALFDVARPDAAPFDAEPRAPAAAFVADLRVAGVPAAAGVRPVVAPRAVPAAEVLEVFFAETLFEADLLATVFFAAAFFAEAFFAAARPPAAPLRVDAPGPAAPERLAGVARPPPPAPVEVSCAAARPTLVPTFLVTPRVDAPRVETAPALPYGPVLSVAVRRASEPPVVPRVPAPLFAGRFAAGSRAAIFLAGRLPTSAASASAFPARARAVALAVGAPALRDEGRDALDLPRAVLVMRISRLRIDDETCNATGAQAS